MGGSQRRDHYVDPVAVGELIVSIANLAWTLYLGLRTKTAKPTSEVVARSVRVELRRRGETDPAALDTITAFSCRSTITQR